MSSVGLRVYSQNICTAREKLAQIYLQYLHVFPSLLESWIYIMQSNSETDIMQSWKWKLYHAMQMIQNTSACHKEVKRKFYIGIFSLICFIWRMFQFLCLLHNNRGSLLLSSFQMLPQFFWLYLLSVLSDDGGPFFIFFLSDGAVQPPWHGWGPVSLFLITFIVFLPPPHRPHIRRGPFNKWRIISPPSPLWDSQ